MPATCRLLYYDLGMSADDDGFVEWYGVLAMTRANEQDLQVLQANEFVRVFDEKVLLIRDWKENNYIQQDRYHKSKYLDVYKMDTECIQPVSKVDTEVRVRLELGKVRVTNSYVAEATEEVEEMKALWKENAGTTLRNHVEENLKDYRYLKGELGAELTSYLQAVRMIRADQYQKRSLQEKLINYSGVRVKLEAIEGYMGSKVDQSAINQPIRI